MIPVARILNHAEEVLSLRSALASRYEPSHARYALGEILQELQTRVPELERELTVTLQAGVGEYDLPLVVTNADTGTDDPTNVNQILRLHWPYANMVPVVFIEPGNIEEVRRQIDRKEADYSTTQPNWYTVVRTPSSDGQRTKLLIEAASSVRAGTLTITYYPLAWYLATAPQTQKIDVPIAYEAMLKAGVLWKLAEIYAKDRADRYLMMYERQVDIWQHNQYNADQAVHQGEIQVF